MISHLGYYLCPCNPILDNWNWSVSDHLIVEKVALERRDKKHKT